MASNPGSIPAGGKDKISIIVQTTNRGGQTLHKRFVVQTNDLQHRRVDLTVTGKVMAYAAVDPPYIRLVGRQGEVVSASVIIRPQPGFPFSIKDVKSGSEGNIKVDLQPLGEKPTVDGFRLFVTTIKTDVGSFRDYITVQTDLKQKPTLRIPVSGRITPVMTNPTPAPAQK